MSGLYGLVTTKTGRNHQKIASNLKNFHLRYGSEEGGQLGDRESDFGTAYTTGVCYQKIREISDTTGTFETTSIIFSADALLFNRTELVTRLVEKGVCLPEVNDNRLLFELYLQFGISFTDYVEGDFAIAIWLKKQKKLILIRDQMGVRPLFFYKDSDLLAFATDQRSLYVLRENCSLHIDENFLKGTLLNGIYYNNKRTAFEEIAIVPAAHRVELTFSMEGEVVSTDTIQYWFPQRKRIDITAIEAKEKLRGLIEDAVKKRINVSSQPVGCDVSGGLDSTILAMYMKKNRPEDSYFHSWSPDKNQFPLRDEVRDERHLILDLEGRYNVKCNYSTFNEEAVRNVDFIRSSMTEVPGTKDNFQQVLGLEYFSKNGVTLAVSGTGGDQGASHHGSPEAILKEGDVFRFLRELFYTDGANPVSYFNRLFYHTPKRLYNRRFRKADVRVTSALCIDRKKSRTISTQKMFSKFHEAFISGGLQMRIESTAYIAAEYGIQYTYPMLDKALVEFVLSLPQHFFFRNGKTRWLFREAYSHCFDSTLIANRDKSDDGLFICLDEKLEKYFDVQKSSLLSSLHRNFWENKIDLQGLEEVYNGQWNRLRPSEKRISLWTLKCLVDIQAICMCSRSERGLKGSSA